MSSYSPERKTLFVPSGRLKKNKGLFGIKLLLYNKARRLRTTAGQCKQEKGRSFIYGTLWHTIK